MGAACGGTLWRNFTLANLKSSSPLLAQTSHPPTRNLSGKTHDAMMNMAPATAMFKRATARQ